MLALFREISLRHWLKSPLRSALVIVGISLGVALHVATETASDSIFAAFGEFVERISGRADLSVEGGSVGVPTTLVADLSEVEGVDHVAATLELTAQAPELHETLLIFGVDMLGDLHFLPFDAADGEKEVIKDPLSFVNDPLAVLLSRKFATRHNLAAGDTVQLLTSEGEKPFKVRGLLEDSGPAASFGGQVAVMFMDAAQVSFARGIYADRIDIALAEGADPAETKAAIQEAIGDGYRVESPASMGDRLQAMVEPLRGALWLSGFLAMLVGGFLVYNSVGVAVAQRRREIGMLRAFGVTRGATTFLFCAEAAILALPGIALGLWLGSVLSELSTAKALHSINQLYFSVPEVQAKLTPKLMLVSGSAGMITAIFSAYWPARQGARTDPAIILRGSSAVEKEPIPTKKYAVIGAFIAASAWLPQLQGHRAGAAYSIMATLIGIGFMTPALIKTVRRGILRVVDLGMGISARLGLDYVERSLGRSTVNVLALMVAVSMSVSVGGWLSSFEQSIVSWADRVGVADLSVTQGSPILDRQHVAYGEDVVARVEALPEVEAVQPFRIIDQTVGGKMLRVVATDLATFAAQSDKRDKGWKVVSGASIDEALQAKGNNAILSENGAKLLGVDAGDTLTLPSPKGPLLLTVRSVVVDYTAESGALFISRDLYLDAFDDHAIDGTSVFLREGTDVSTAADHIREALGDTQGIFVSRTETVRGQIIETVRNTFSYSRSVELVTLLIALMGIIGTMIATVIDRTRELGMLRAIGATTRQVATSIVAEAGFLGLCAAVIGIAAGVLQCQLFLNTLLIGSTGFHIQFVFPWEASTRIGSLVVLTAAAAGGLPALRAARTDVAAATVYD